MYYTGRCFLTKRVAIKIIKMHRDKFTKQAIDSVIKCDARVGYMILNPEVFDRLDDICHLLIKAHNIAKGGWI